MGNVHVESIEKVVAKVAINQIKNGLDDKDYRAMVRGVVLGYHLLFSRIDAHEIAQIFEDAYNHLCFGSDERAINKLKLLLP